MAMKVRSTGQAPAEAVDAFVSCKVPQLSRIMEKSIRVIVLIFLSH